MGWADYMSRNPVGKAHEVSEYDQNFSVAVIQRLKRMLQKCRVRVIKTANQNRHVNRMLNQTTEIVNESNSTISSIPSDYEETSESVSGFFTAQESTSSHGQNENTDDKPTVDQNLVRAIIAAMDSRKPETVENTTETKEAQVIMHFSPKH